MGGRGPDVVKAARDIYQAWAGNHHFEMYDDVEPVLRALVEQGFIVGVISNSHRSLDAFLEHFSLHGLIHAHVSSAEHGYLKPHRSIFDEALVRAGAAGRDVDDGGRQPEGGRAGRAGGRDAGGAAAPFRRCAGRCAPGGAGDSRADGAGGAPLTGRSRKSRAHLTAELH